MMSRDDFKIAGDQPRGLSGNESIQEITISYLHIDIVDTSENSNRAKPSNIFSSTLNLHLSASYFMIRRYKIDGMIFLVSHCNGALI